MPEKEPKDAITRYKIAAFDWVTRALIGLVVWLVIDMHNDVKEMMLAIPVLKMEISNMKDKQLEDHTNLLKLFPIGKHEDLITYDSLTKQP